MHTYLDLGGSEQGTDPLVPDGSSSDPISNVSTSETIQYDEGIFETHESSSTLQPFSFHLTMQILVPQKFPTPDNSIQVSPHTSRSIWMLHAYHAHPIFRRSLSLV